MPTEQLNIFIALAAGLVSFVSPCVLPLVPSYISFIGGAGIPDDTDKSSRGQLMLKTLLFVAGFTLVFMVTGMIFSSTAAAFSGATAVINAVAGSVVMLFGINLLGDFFKFLNYEKRFHLRKSPSGYLGPAVLGMAFAAGWSPCIGPILASILALAASGTSPFAGAALLGAYSLGLALPFLLTSLFLSRAQIIMKRIKPHMRTIQRASGILLILLGLSMVFGRYTLMTNWLVGIGYRLQYWQSSQPGPVNAVCASILLLPAVAFFTHAIVLSKSNSNNKPAIQKQVIWGSAFAVFAVLQGLGIIDLVSALAKWLSFQGI